MNENNEENLEELQETVDIDETELSALGDGEDIEESDASNVASGEETETTVDDSVSGGDSTEVLEQILIELQLNNEKMEEIQTYRDEHDMNLFTKPLQEYTVTEGLLLLLFLGFVAYSVFHLVGGILRCKKQ